MQQQVQMQEVIYFSMTSIDFEKLITSTNPHPLQDFLARVNVGILFIDPAGYILYANDAQLNLLGYSKKDFTINKMQQFTETPLVAENILQRLLQEEDLKNQPLKITAKNGSIKDVLINSNRYVQNGELQYTCLVVRDITALKKSENLIKLLNIASEELSITHNTVEALDKISNFIIPNFADWFVINELRNDNYAHLLKMAHADPNKVVFAKKYRSEHPIDYNDPQPGSVGWVMRTGQPLFIPHLTEEMIERGARDAEQAALLKELCLKSLITIPMQVQGKVTGVISFMSCNELNIYDETDLNFAKDFANRIALTLENIRLYEELTKEIDQRIKADKKKDEFISIASHELRTPVTTLKAYTQILQMSFEEQHNEKAIDMVSKMDKQINKLTVLIGDLLDVTKIEKGELVFTTEAFDFNAMVQEITEEMQRTTQTHDIVLKLGEGIKVNGDRNRISQVLTNFISNAIKYSPSADKIIVSVESIDNNLKCSVLDFGIGIPEEQQPKIFERFYRANNNATYPGLGLGLYISSEIIKKHNGKIYFQSVKDEGSTFCFEMPC